MRVSRRWKSAFAGALAAAGLALGSAGVLAQGRQAGPLMWLKSLGFAESHDRRAYKILDRRPQSPELSAAMAADRRALDLSPYNNAARLRLAYADTLKKGHLKGEGLDRFAESYSLVPFDYTVAAWRIAFGLEHWAELPPDVRRAVYAEAIAYGRSQSQDVGVPRVLQSVHNPEGRLAAALWLREIPH